MKTATKRTRLDVLLQKRGLAESREKAKRLILAGMVFVDQKREDKCGRLISDDSALTLVGEERYVSRGGIKLEKPLSFFGISLEGKTALDTGASTGGFTDCLLKNGVDKVYAVDVGYGQLSWKLRLDKRVIVMDRTNVRRSTRDDFDDEIDLATLDLSFISLTKVLQVIYPILSSGGEVIALVKPQFEVGKGELESGGVIRCSKKQAGAVEKVSVFSCSIGFSQQGVVESPIRGAKGNREFFLYLKK